MGDLAGDRTPGEVVVEHVDRRPFEMVGGRAALQLVTGFYVIVVRRHHGPQLDRESPGLSERGDDREHPVGVLAEVRHGDEAAEPHGEATQAQSADM